MGGRGTFASGNTVPYTYKTVGMVEGVKILEGVDKRHHSLPEESHSAWAYIRLKRDGKTLHEMRIYNEKHEVIMDIGYHGESSLNGGNHNTDILHVHEYGKGGDFKNRNTRRLTEEEYQKYKRYFIGVPENGLR